MNHHHFQWQHLLLIRMRFSMLVFFFWLTDEISAFLHDDSLLNYEFCSRPGEVQGWKSILFRVSSDGCSFSHERFFWLKCFTVWCCFDLVSIVSITFKYKCELWRKMNLFFLDFSSKDYAGEKWKLRNCSVHAFSIEMHRQEKEKSINFLSFEAFRIP